MKKIFIAGCMLVNLFAAAQKVSGDKIPGTDCEHTTEDKFTGASNRSATPCEIQLEKQIRTAFRQAFARLMTEWSEKDWVMNNNSNIDQKDIQHIGRGTEKNFFNPGSSDGGNFFLELNMNPALPAFREYYDQYNAFMDEMKSGLTAAVYQRFAAFDYKMRNATNIRVRTSVNDFSNSMIAFKNGFKPISIPGAAYAFRASTVSSLSGGDISSSMDACLILIGKLKYNIVKDADGTQRIDVTAIFPQKTSRLTIQYIMLRIECNPELLDKVIKDVNWSSLSNLISK